MANFFHLIITTPFYNGFILLMNLLPFFDAGMIIVIFTIIVKFLLLPLSIKASKSQLQMKSTEKDLAIIKEKYKDSREEQSRKTMEYYKEKGINPFAGFFILLVQLPILIGLYRVFIKSGLPIINTALLYTFVSVPTSVNMVFLHFVNISEKSLLLAVLAGISTYFQISLASESQPSGGSGDMAKAMQMQMKYFFPILMAFISYSISSAIAIYFITSNIFAIGQEIYIKRKYHKSAFVE
jgi:YidC/Oxa1 family membrane protein insertase